MTEPSTLAASDLVELAKGLAWPLLVAVLVWRLLPSIRRVIDSRGFTLKVGGAEITVQDATTLIERQLDDLRAQLSAVKAGANDGAPASGDEAGAESSPIQAGVPRLTSVLWVDDHPENNAFEMAALRRQGVEVVTAHTTAEGLRQADARGAWDAVVSDVGREEQGEFRPDAGLQLAKQVHERHPDVPVFIYTSAPTLARVREHPDLSQIAGATASGTELLDMLGRVGCGAVARSGRVPA